MENLICLATKKQERWNPKKKKNQIETNNELSTKLPKGYKLEK